MPVIEIALGSNFVKPSDFFKKVVPVISLIIANNRNKYAFIKGCFNLTGQRNDDFKQSANVVTSKLKTGDIPYLIQLTVMQMIAA